MEYPYTNKKRPIDIHLYDDRAWRSGSTRTALERPLRDARLASSLCAADDETTAAAIHQAKRHAICACRAPDEDTDFYPEDEDAKCASFLNIVRIVVRVSAGRLDDQQEHLVAERVFGYLKLENRHYWWKYLGDPPPEDIPHLYDLVRAEVCRITGDEPPEELLEDLYREAEKLDGPQESEEPGEPEELEELEGQLEASEDAQLEPVSNETDPDVQSDIESTDSEYEREMEEAYRIQGWI